MACRFGSIENGAMQLNANGEIAYKEWAKLCERFLNFELDVFQIMPNHMHGIIVLNPVGAGLAPAKKHFEKIGARLAPVKNHFEKAGASPAPTDAHKSFNENKTIGAGASPAPTDAHISLNENKTIGDIVGAYKSLVTNACLKEYKLKNKVLGKLWQRNYYEHIIRSESSYKAIAQYIMQNPENWEEDKFFQPSE